MPKIGVAVCGNSGLDYMQHDKEIRIFRSLLNLGGKEYEDFVGINAAEFYKILDATPDIPAFTAQTSTGYLLNMYEEMKAAGYDEAIVITISAPLSGTYQNALLASRMIEGFPVHLFDSKSVSYVEAKMALKAWELAKKGKTVPEIFKVLETIRDNNHIFVTVDTLKFLVKNGRLSNAAGFLGGLLKLKPLLEVSKEGKVETIDKIRTTSKAREAMVQRFVEETKNLTNYETFIVYTNNLDEMTEYAKHLETDHGIKNIRLVPLTPVVGCHAGPGTMGLGYVPQV